MVNWERMLFGIQIEDVAIKHIRVVLLPVGGFGRFGVAGDGITVEGRNISLKQNIRYPFKTKTDALVSFPTFCVSLKVRSFAKFGSETSRTSSKTLELACIPNLIVFLPPASVIHVTSSCNTYS